MAVPTFVSAGAIANDLTGAASVTPTPPAHLADDILFAVSVNQAASTQTTATAGWTRIAESAPSTTRVAWFWKRATGAGTAGPTITAASTDQFCVVYVFRGCITTGNPYETNGSPNNQGTDALPITQSITTTGTDRLVVAFCGHDDDTTVSGNPPAGWTANSNLTDANGTQAGFRLMSIAAAAPTTVVSATLGTLATAEFWGMMTLALASPPIPYTPATRTFQPYLAQ